MKFLITILFGISLTLQAQTNNVDYYKNIKGELKPLTEIIEEAQRSIAINEVDVPYLTYTNENLFNTPYGKKERGRYIITTEINKIKIQGTLGYKIRTIVYFKNLKENNNPKLYKFYNTVTKNINKTSLLNTVIQNIDFAKNEICSALATQKNNCEFEEFWGD